VTCGLAPTRIHDRLACDIQVRDLEASYRMEPSGAGAGAGAGVTSVQCRVGWAAEISEIS
jgi:hypothetical protein